MNRPQMKGPDGKIINIFSNEFEEYLDEGYTIEQLLNINRKQFPILETSPHIPLTGYPDIDLQILGHLDIYDFNRGYKINRYTEQLSQRDDFWKQKIVNENLYIPNPLNIMNVNWRTVYNAAYHTLQYIEELNVDGYIIFDKYTPAYINNILKKININDELDVDTPLYGHFKLSYNENDNNYVLEFVYSHFAIIYITLNKLQAYDFIFYSLYYNIKD